MRIVHYPEIKYLKKKICNSLLCYTHKKMMTDLEKETKTSKNTIELRTKTGTTRRQSQGKNQHHHSVVDDNKKKSSTIGVFDHLNSIGKIVSRSKKKEKVGITEENKKYVMLLILIMTMIII